MTRQYNTIFYNTVKKNNDATLDTLCFLRSYYRKRFQQLASSINVA